MGIIILFLGAISLVNKRWQSRPIFAAQMAVVLQWLLVAAPHAMIVSQFFSIASAIKNSSFLTLFPVKSVPVRSSLLIKHFTPSNPKSHGSIGVGPFAKIALISYTGEPTQSPRELKPTFCRRNRYCFRNPFWGNPRSYKSHNFFILFTFCLHFLSIWVTHKNEIFSKCLNDLSN